MSKKKFYYLFFVVTFAILVLFSAKIIYGSLNNKCYSNRLMSFSGNDNVTVFTTIFSPWELKFKKWYDEENPVVISSANPDSKNYKKISDGSYQVSTTRGNVISFFTILESQTDQKLYFSFNNAYEVDYVTKTATNSQLVDAPKIAIACFPITIKNRSEIIKRAQNHVFEKLKGVK